MRGSEGFQFISTNLSIIPGPMLLGMYSAFHQSTRMLCHWPVKLQMDSTLGVVSMQTLCYKRASLIDDTDNQGKFGS